MYARFMQHNRCDAGPGHIKIVLGSVIPFCQNQFAEASSSYSLQTDFQDGGQVVFSNGTNFKSNLANVVPYHPFKF